MTKRKQEDGVGVKGSWSCPKCGTADTGKIPADTIYVIEVLDEDGDRYDPPPLMWGLDGYWGQCSAGSCLARTFPTEEHARTFLKEHPPHDDSGVPRGARLVPATLGKPTR